MEADILIAWNHGAIPEAVKSVFQRPTKFINLPNPDSWAHSLDDLGYPFPIKGILQKYAFDTTPLRVAALGFSASCQGVAQLLASADGARFDAVVAIDGIHVGYDAQHKPNAAGMSPWLAYGKYAVVNERLFVISHSSVVPPNYASTTETAKYLWDTLTSGGSGAQPPLPAISVPPTSIHVAGGPVTGVERTIDYPAPAWNQQDRFGGLVVLGCDNRDKPGTADHIYQAKAMLPMALTTFLADRWNGMDPKAPGQSCYVA